MLASPRPERGSHDASKNRRHEYQPYHRLNRGAEGDRHDQRRTVLGRETADRPRLADRAAVQPAPASTGRGVVPHRAFNTSDTMSTLLLDAAVVREW